MAKHSRVRAGRLNLCTGFMVLVSLAGCSTTPESGGVPDPAAPGPSVPGTPVSPPPPWGGNALGAADIPAVYLTQWRAADNRAACALIALSHAEPNAVPRAATFSGGWAVAYDMPELRSAFGIAGTGSAAADPSYDDWPHHIRWSDGSTAGYGPEGGSGPNQLAYLRITGQHCLYNVWSRLGRPHLETILSSLRFVDTR